MMRAAAVIFTLTRLVFLSILLPVYFHHGDFVVSLEMSFPVLTIGTGAFSITDAELPIDPVSCLNQGA
jgi:hypothetical protein